MVTNTSAGSGAQGAGAPAGGEAAELARFPRMDGEVARLRRCVATSGAPYFDLRRWYKRRDVDELGPTKAGETIRVHEAPVVIAALWRALDDAGRAEARKLLAGAPGFPVAVTPAPEGGV